MDELSMLRAIVNSYPYPIVFVDDQYIIRYMNRYAKYHYNVERGYPDLIGRSLFECHNEEKSREHIMQSFEAMKPVRGEDGKVCGFFERFELNLQK